MSSYIYHKVFFSDVFVNIFLTRIRTKIVADPMAPDPNQGIKNVCGQGFAKKKTICRPRGECILDPAVLGF